MVPDIELRQAINKMAGGKATKTNDIPVEIFKALALEPDSSLDWLLNLCNHCWQNKVIPDEWSTASVAMLFKKGDPANANNYRPICLQSIAYTLFSSLLKQRFLDAGAESRFWKSQFGFRKGCCTEDAIYVALRKVEQACARRNGQIRLLALDWKKAFDSINLVSLFDASPFWYPGLLLEYDFWHDEASLFLCRRSRNQICHKRPAIRNLTRLHVESVAFHNNNDRIDA